MKKMMIFMWNATTLTAEEGQPNVHPLSVREGERLAKAFHATAEKETGFLQTRGMLSENILCLDQSRDGQVMWFTPAQRVNLFFVASLGIADGQANVPAMLWRATKTTVEIWALDSNQRPLPESRLYQAPFFNVYADGKVCLGDVTVKIPANCNLEEFISLWQQYVFSSRFSHLLIDRSPVKGNLVQLWKGLIETAKTFPIKSLVKTHQTLKDLLP